MILDKVVTNGVALDVPAHMSVGQTFLDKVREYVNIAVGLKNLGVKPGDVVAVCGDSRSEYIAAAMGAVCCGAIATFINCLMLAPPVVVFIAKSPLVEKYDTSSVEGIWCGAAPLSEQTMEQLRRRMPNFKKLIEGYGMTETTMGVLKCIDEIEAKRGLRPIPGVKVKIVDCETREKLGPNEKGEVCVKGPHSAVADCGVVGKPDEVAGELPTAFVVLKPRATVTESDILDFTATKLSPIARLRGGVIFLNEIPKSPSGKILRRLLKQKLLERD
ncbi:4-coumarate-CoA ligase [Operophtera brumata]|uniref:4-coumarate-CoA ligase n=1 Tax=Operophtera brumata TaxID=104452 RepID=A0A0L7K2V0_OPEBR|nr:4-coumarate-CoA ligase [Operophtera brumata]